MNDKENTTSKLMRCRSIALGRKLIGANAYIKKEERSQTITDIHLKALEKEEYGT